jgi:hypothetical protein
MDLPLDIHGKTAGVQEQRQAWGVAGTSPPHTVRLSAELLLVSR